MTKNLLVRYLSSDCRYFPVLGHKTPGIYHTGTRFEPVNYAADNHVIKVVALATSYVVIHYSRATFGPDDYEARSAMHLASVYAGIGFGNGGCHLW